MRNINSGEIFQINLSKRESSCHPKVLCDLFDTKEPKDVALRCQKAQSAATTSLTHLIAMVLTLPLLASCFFFKYWLEAFILK